MKKTNIKLSTLNVNSFRTNITEVRGENLRGGSSYPVGGGSNPCRLDTVVDCITNFGPGEPMC
ncbi:MAG: hypothetical protein WBB45_02435 [Cyclobacteriaceae bacterium]